MRNFPLSRGAVAGILKGYVGLSAAVYTVLYTGVLHNSSTKLLLFLTLGIPAICLAMMYFVRPCTPALEDDSTEHGHFLFTQISSVVLGVYLLTATILDDVLSLSHAVTYALFGVMILLLLAPLAIPIKMTLYRSTRKRASLIGPSSSSDRLSAGDQDKSEPLLAASSSTTNLGDPDDSSDIDMLLAEGEGAVKKKRRPKRGEDFEFREALIKADFWLLFTVYFLGVGSGVTVLNNLAQIGIATGADDTTILLCLFSFCNFVGRLGGGVVSEHFVRYFNFIFNVQILQFHFIFQLKSVHKTNFYVAWFSNSFSIPKGISFIQTKILSNKRFCRGRKVRFSFWTLKAEASI